MVGRNYLKDSIDREISQTRLRLNDLKNQRGSVLLTPGSIKTTPCKERTNSFLRHTPHGVVKIEYRSAV